MVKLMVDVDGAENLIKLINKQIAKFDKAAYINYIITCTRGTLQQCFYFVIRS